jgi:hypothetical protein
MLCTFRTSFCLQIPVLHNKSELADSEKVCLQIQNCIRILLADSQLHNKSELADSQLHKNTSHQFKTAQEFFSQIQNCIRILLTDSKPHKEFFLQIQNCIRILLTDAQLHNKSACRFTAAEQICWKIQNCFRILLTDLELHNKCAFRCLWIQKCTMRLLSGSQLCNKSACLLGDLISA